MIWLRRLLTFAMALVLVLVVISFFLPKVAQVERSTVVGADPHTVFPYINNLKTFQRWSPWSDLDPTIDYQFSDPASGVGATMRWSSTQEDVGEGSLEIVETIPDEMVRLALDFGSMGTASSYFFIEPVDGGSEVTWGFETQLSADPVSRYVGLLYDTWLGNVYERGLENLKTLVQTENQLATEN